MAVVPFNVPYVTDRELIYIADAIVRRELAGNGHYGGICSAWLRKQLGVVEALLTHSCTAALEMAAILCNLESGDEVIMPSFTFVSTANAVVLRGAVPVFVDIRPDTLNIDTKCIEAALTSRTKAIFVVHYAGVPCDMDRINGIAREHGLLVVEDAAQALQSTYKGVPAGRLGDMACFSFHATKNVNAGEGGAFVTCRPDLADRAHVIWEKGTNRRRFIEGRVDKYSWVDIGSSYLPSEITAAFLLAQLEGVNTLTQERLRIWETYHSAFEPLERIGALIRPTVPPEVTHNGHIYYLLLQCRAQRDALIAELKRQGIEAPFHYIPLHSSDAGRRFGRTNAPLTVTEDASERLIRLPIWAHIEDAQIARVVEAISAFTRLN